MGLAMDASAVSLAAAEARDTEDWTGLSFKIPVTTQKQGFVLSCYRQNAHFFKNGHFLMQIMQPSSPKQVWISSI